jgi:hypothetical protein
MKKDIVRGDRYTNYLGKVCVVKSVYRNIIKLQVLDEAHPYTEVWEINDFLKNKSETIELWIESRKKSASNVFIEDSIKRELFNHSNCSSVFKSTLDLKKLLELGIVKLEFEDIKNVIIGNNG